MPLFLLLPLEALIFAPPVAIGVAAAKKQGSEQIVALPGTTENSAIPIVPTGNQAPLAAMPSFAIRPGQWEYRTELLIPGAPVALAPPARQRCLSPKDIEEKRHLLSEGNRNQCRFDSPSQEEGKQVIAFTCPTPDGEMSGRIRGSATPATLDLETSIHMQPAMQGFSDMVQKTVAKRLGDCSGG